MTTPHRAAVALASEIVATWAKAPRNFFVVVPPLNDGAEFFHLLRHPEELGVVPPSDLASLAIAWCPHGSFGTAEELAICICEAWECVRKPERGYRRWLSDAVAQVRARSAKPILLLGHFHDVVLDLPEELGSCLRDLNQNAGLTCVAEVPLDYPVLLERWRDQGKRGLINSEFGQGYRSRGLKGYTREEVEARLDKDGLGMGWSRPILEVTGGFQHWVNRLIDAIAAKAPRKSWEAELLESPEFANFLAYLDAEGSQANGAALARLFHGVASLDDRNALNGHPWREFLISDQGDLHSSAVGLGCARHCGLHAAGSLAHTASQLIRRGAYPECIGMLVQSGENKGALENEWLIAQVLERTQSGVDEWNLVQRDLNRLQQIFAKSAGAAAASQCLEQWRQFAQKMLLCSKATTSANADPIGWFCGRNGNAPDVRAALQVIGLRLSWAESIASPLLATQAILAIPEALLQLYAALVLELRYWEPPPLDQDQLVAIRALPGKAKFDWPSGEGPLLVGQLLMLSWMRMQAQPARRRLVEDFVELDKLQQLHSQDRNPLVHRLTFSSKEQWQRYSSESRALLATVARILVPEQPLTEVLLPSLLDLLGGPEALLAPVPSAAPVRIPEDDVLAVAKSLFGLSQLLISNDVAGGLSGASVRLVQYSDGAENAMRYGILKTPGRLLDFEAEKRGASDATAPSCWLREHVPTEQSFAESNGRAFILSRLAFPAIGDSRIQSFHDLLLEGESERALAVADQLGSIYGAQLIQGEIRSGPRQQLFSLVWSPWQAAAARVPDWKAVLQLPGREEKRFADEDQNCVNPLACLEDDTLWLNRDTTHLRWNWQHRDLNARNILVAPVQHGEAAPTLRLIDLEKVTKASAVLDVCWVAFWMLLAGAERGVLPGDRLWAQLPDAFLQASLGVLNPQKKAGRRDFGLFELSLKCIEALFHALAEKQTAASDPLIVRDLAALTLAGSSLAKCFYEVKDVAEGKAIDRRAAHERARCFFRIAARALKPYTRIDRSPISTDISAPFVE